VIRGFQHTGLPVLVWLVVTSAPVRPGSRLDKLKSNYQAVSLQIQKHLVSSWWIDDDPESPELLAQQWSLTGEWVAAWLDAQPSDGPEGVKAALADLVPASEPDYLTLSEDALLVVAPNPIGNVFIVAKLNGHYRLAWSTAQTQEARGKQAKILAAWRPENARHGGRGPYWVASGSVGSVMPRIGKLPSDAKGRPRFYIDGIYAQEAGGTVGAQTSVWLWDGTTARPQVARDYAVMIDQRVGTRVEGDLLKVQHKKFFRTFYSCGMCEERQTDWIVRLSPVGIEDLGEKSTVPELDAVDELFYRVIHHKSTTDVATAAAAKAADKIVAGARAGTSEKQWKEFPTLGMMMGWKVQDNSNGKVLCLSFDDGDSHLFTLKFAGSRLFIAEVKQSDRPCEE
jgi:hypothetical protein